MKKFFLFAALAFGLASCQNNTNIFGIEVNPDEDPVEFTITVTAPDVDETRAGYTNSGEGAIANGVLGEENDNVTLRYILDIYIYDQETSKYVLSGNRYTEYSDERTVTFNPALVPGRDYNLVVWIDIVTKDSEANWVNELYDVTDLAAVTINTEKWAPMDEMRDAFSGYTQVTLTANSGNITVPCTRPFGKLRVITTDMEALGKLNVTPARAKVVYTDVPTYSFDATTGTYNAESSVAKTHEFTIAAYGSNTASDMALYTDYFFAPSDNQAALGAFTLEVYDQNGGVINMSNLGSSIPVKRNTLTTVKGNFLTLQNINLQVVVENNGSFTGEIDQNGNTIAQQ